MAFKQPYACQTLQARAGGHGSIQDTTQEGNIIMATKAEKKRVHDAGIKLERAHEREIRKSKRRKKLTAIQREVIDAILANMEAGNDTGGSNESYTARAKVTELAPSIYECKIRKLFLGRS